MITVMSPDGKPIQVAANSLQMAGVQNQNGKQNFYNRSPENCEQAKNAIIIENDLHKNMIVFSKNPTLSRTLSLKMYIS